MTETSHVVIDGFTTWLVLVSVRDVEVSRRFQEHLTGRCRDQDNPAPSSGSAPVE